MSLFPRFGAARPAKAANPANVSTLVRDDAQGVSSFRNISSLAPLEILQAGVGLDMTRIADLADAWRERIAIVLEPGDIGEADAHRIAEAEIGRRFVETFITCKVAP